MDNKKSKTVYSSIIFFILISAKIYAQDISADFINQYNNKNYSKSIEVIEKRLRELYSKRVDYRIVSLDFISMKKPENEIDLKKFFRTRKNINKSVEENSELFNLHYYAGRCYYNIKKYDSSLNHFSQALRFKNLEFNKDDNIFYEIAQVYLKKKEFPAYVNMLEAASTLNPDKFEYSHELGIQLARTGDKKKAIYHLERYMKHTEESADPNLYITIGNLNEDTGKYLETERYYKKYLDLKPDDANILFALANISYMRTGNYTEALLYFKKSLQILPEKDLFRKSKSYEYIGDISWKNLDYKRAIESYREVIKYQEKVLLQIKGVEKKINDLDNKIKDIKSAIIIKKDFDDFAAYEILLEDKGKVEQELNSITREYEKLNPGKVRWFMADSFEKDENYQEALDYYRQSIAFNYNPNEAREKMTKLQLKIKRGY